jgi:ATP-dependent Zn protease
MATVASAEVLVLNSKEAIATGFPQHSAHEVSIPPCVKMPMAADTEIKDFTKELEVKEPATIAISGEARTVFMNKDCQQKFKFFFMTLTAVEQSQFMVVSKKDKKTDVTSTTPNISLDRRIVIVIVSVFFFLLFFFASII